VTSSGPRTGCDRAVPPVILANAGTSPASRAPS
jgi:hypothetical protein